MDIKKGDIEHGIILNPGSLLTLTSEARNRWTHGIVARKSDYYDVLEDLKIANKKYPRKLRISITFRTLA